MNRQALIENTLKKLKRLPDSRIKEVSDFADFLLSKIDEQMIQEGIQQIVSDSDTFDFVLEDEEIYSVKDLKEKYK